MKSTVGNVLFTGAYFLCLTDALLFGYSTFSQLPCAAQLSIVLKVCAAVLVFTKLILESRYPLRLLLLYISAGLILTISFIFSRYSHIFYLLLTCMGLRGIDVRRLLERDFQVRLVLGLLIVLSSVTGVIENYVTYRTGIVGNRYSMGFTHPNTLACLVLSLILQDAWLHSRRPTKVYCLTVFLISLPVYLITVNRTAVLLTLLFPLLLLLGGRKRHLQMSGISRQFWIWLFPALSLLSLLIMHFCSSSGFFGLLDLALSRRFRNAQVICSTYGVSLLGQWIELISVKSARLNHSSIALLDVAYLRLLLQGGVLTFVLVAVLYSRFSGHVSRAHNYRLQQIILVFLLLGLCESGFNNVYLNFTLVLAAKDQFDPKDTLQRKVLL